MPDDTNPPETPDEGGASALGGTPRFHKASLIHDDIDIEFEIELGTITGVDPNAVIMVGLVGTATIP
jgi:hypothetical protein